MIGAKYKAAWICAGIGVYLIVRLLLGIVDPSTMQGAHETTMHLVGAR